MMRTQLNLFDMAEANAAHITALYLQIAHRSEVTAFVEAVSSRAGVSMNHKPEVIVSVLLEGQILNSAGLAEKTGVTRERRITDQHRPVKARRLAFDESFRDSERFFYGALNLETLGTAGKNGFFGSYCLVLHNRVFEDPACAAACLKTDSLNDLYWDNSTLRVDVFHADLAPFTHRGFLAAIKLSDQLADAAVSYGGLLISKHRNGRDEYVEVLLTTERLGRDDISSIRVDKATITAQVAQSFVPEASSGTRDTPAFYYRQIAQLCQRFNVALEEIVS